eukprot:15470888-Alexandrium_andersonii.AAC.1
MFPRRRPRRDPRHLPIGRQSAHPRTQSREGAPRCNVQSGGMRGRIGDPEGFCHCVPMLG